MRVVLFDLGDTLEHNGALLPGARETLTALAAIRDDAGQAPVVALVSDYYPATNPVEIDSYRQSYYQLLSDLGLDGFFTPLQARVTLSTEVGVGKPAEKIFRVALDKIHPQLPFTHAIFVTENEIHVKAAQKLGMSAIRVARPSENDPTAPRLDELLPQLERLLTFAPCGRKTAVRSATETVKTKQPNPFIESKTAKVDAARLRKTVLQLAAFETRWSFAPKIREVPGWIHKQFVAQGYPANTATRFQDFALPGSQPQQNVICGRKTDAGIILICAHYDSLSEDPSTFAPGADDNACGVAALIELSRILKDVPLKHSVLFAAFGGEEQGLFGSSSCAAIAAQEKWPIELVINLDMISFTKPGGPARTVVEFDQGNVKPGNDAAAKHFATVMAQAAADYTSLEVEHANIERSDYMPFEAEGFACIGVYNADENPVYHTTSDTPDKIDFSFLKQQVQMVLATVLTISS
ncbi:MAG TPA: M20/M25/M40 family metallo-hydrolase [Pyrinomonadaceae bacterium]|nr:M20/M25/M40 family metallo-hydrolase [Pyrinomonadaceae bacterium]